MRIQLRIFFTDSRGGLVAFPFQFMFIGLAGARRKLERQILSTIQSHWADYWEDPAKYRNEIEIRELEFKNELGELLEFRHKITVVATQRALPILKTIVAYFEDPENVKEEDGIDIETVELGAEIGPVMELRIEKTKMDVFPIQLKKKETIRFKITTFLEIRTNFPDPKEKERDQTIEDLTILFKGTRFKLESQILSIVRSYLEAPEAKKPKVELKKGWEPLEMEVVGTQLTLQILQTIVRNLEEPENLEEM